MAKAPRDAHEWVSFDDEEEERTWRFDVTFLESRWTCIFGAGCQGVLTGPTPELVQGCCSYGAHLVDGDDAERVRTMAGRLTDAEWQLRGEAPDDVVERNEAGDLVTALVDDACVFLNRPGFDAGAGCAFHVAAANRGEHYVDWKPEVCWQLPLRREEEVGEDGHVTTSIGQWDRRHWGEGGAEFAWWCTEEPAAFVGAERVVDEMSTELTAMVGATTYRRLLAYLEERNLRMSKGVALEHPVVRRRATKR